MITLTQNSTMDGNSSLALPFQNSSVNTEYTTAHNSIHQDCVRSNNNVDTILKALAYSVILAVSLVGNLLVLLIIYKNKQLRKSPINYFIFNMAVSDLFNPLTIIPVKIVEIISGSQSWKVDSPWLLGNILCKLAYFLPDVSLVVSIESLLLISIDRLFAVVYPLKASLISSTVRITSIVCTWIVAIAVHAPYFYTMRLFPHENEAICKLDWGPAFDHLETHRRFVTATFITFFLVPFCLLVIVYGTIAWTLKMKNKKSKQELSCIQRQRDQQLRKTVRMSVAIIIAFVVCFTPLLVYMFTGLFLWNWDQASPICSFRTVVPFFSFFMFHSWSAVNPCICLICIKIYRSSLRRILPLSK